MHPCYASISREKRNERKLVIEYLTKKVVFDFRAFCVICG